MARRVHRGRRGILITAGLLLVAGMVDLSPSTDLGKIVTVIHGIAELGIIAALVSAIATQRLRAEGIGTDA